MGLVSPTPTTDGGTPAAPSWWLMIRRIIIFLLGCWVIVDSLVEKETASVGKLLVGLIMVGVLPLEDLGNLVTARQRRRLRQGDDVDPEVSTRGP